MRTFSVLVLSAVILAAAPAARADAVAEVTSFSLFKQVDLAKLAKGEVLVQGGPVMKFPRGLEVQSLFVLPLPLKRADELQQRWNGARHSELKIYQHLELPRKPAPGDFPISAAPKNSAVRSFFSATEKFDPADPVLQMSASEAKGAKGDPAAFWSALLATRTGAFSSGGLGGQPAYIVKGRSIRPADDAAELLGERPAIRKQFSALAGAMTGGGSFSSLFYEMIDVEGRAAVSLGANYSRAAGESIQGGTVQFYASDGLLVLLTFTQAWPVQIDGKTATLVWRGDLLSSRELGDLRGIERSGAVVATRKEIQKNIVAMMKDLSSQR